MKIIYSDVLIIGGGLAGLRTAIGAARRGCETLILSLVPPKRSHSAAAQGGMQASLANCSQGAGDNETVHFVDTVRGSDWGGDQQVAALFAHMAPKAVRELAAWGVPWNRVQRGAQHAVINGKQVTLHERDDAHGLIAARNFGGTAKWRTAFAADGTGHSMLYAISDQAIARAIPVHERVEAIALLHDGQRCYGCIARHLVSGELTAYVSIATCIATGGFGRIYRHSTNALINEGCGDALALETGVAALGNMEAVQFHPTALFPSGILMTEGCRGDGGLLLDAKQHRFMVDAEPEKKELASRDVVARHMEQRIAQGHGVKTRFGDHLWLDIRLLGREHIASKLCEVQTICQHFLGIDPAESLIPVRPAQHYSMGGIRTRYSGESADLVGLFAVGEAACWDLHGFNRLGGNSLAETVVGGMLVGEYIADFCTAQQSQFTVPTGLIADSWQQCTHQLTTLQQSTGSENVFALTRAMQTVMSEKVGIFRDGKTLQQAVDELQSLQQRSAHIALSARHAAANPELVAAYRLKKMLKLALCVALGALQRCESRGAHYRNDYPQRNDHDWLKRTLARWPDSHSSLPTLTYEDIAIGAMALPPGYRGYGAKDYIPHPAAQQHDEHDLATAIEQRLAYRQLLPSRFRGANERL